MLKSVLKLPNSWFKLAQVVNLNISQERSHQHQRNIARLSGSDVSSSRQKQFVEHFFHVWPKWSVPSVTTKQALKAAPSVDLRRYNFVNRKFVDPDIVRPSEDLEAYCVYAIEIVNFQFQRSVSCSSECVEVQKRTQKVTSCVSKRGWD